MHQFSRSTPLLSRIRKGFGAITIVPLRTTESISTPHREKPDKFYGEHLKRILHAYPTQEMHMLVKKPSFDVDRILRDPIIRGI